MKKSLIARLAMINIILMVFIGCTNKNAREISIIPQPQKIEKADGVFTIGSKTVLVDNSGDSTFANVMNHLKEKFNKVAGYELQEYYGEEAVGAHNNAIVFCKNDTLPTEGYVLKVTKENITIEASAGNGAFYAMQTLFQMLPNRAIA